MFHVGQKVVCVNASNGDRESNFGRGYDLGLREGEIYTVLSAHAEFIEVDRVKGGCGWDAVRFRPLVEHKTDISIFQRMLDGASTLERVE